MQRIILIPIFLILSCIFSRAQIVSDWTDRSGIVSSWEQEDKTEVNNWTETLEQFEKTEDVLPDLTSEEDLPSVSWTNITINEKEVRVPSIIENGIDFYLMMEDGIKIYMAANPSAFYEDIDADTIRWIRYYAYSKRNYTARLFKRFKKWEEYITNCMKAESVPTEIGLLCLIESGCTATAVSNKGATGMWQFMPATAREMGLIVNEYSDQRNDPIASTKAAAKYLKKCHNMLGNWTMTIASYNCGIGRTNNIMVRHKTKNWAELKSSFPIETQQYIPALQAIHYVWLYREKLGFEL